MPVTIDWQPIVLFLMPCRQTKLGFQQMKLFLGKYFGPSFNTSLTDQVVEICTHTGQSLPFSAMCDVTFHVEITVSLSQFWMGNWAFLVAFHSTRKGGLPERGGEDPGHVFSQITCFSGGAAIPHCVLASEYSGWIREGSGTLLQYTCLENPMDGGAW